MSELDTSVLRELALAKRSFVDRDFSISLLGSLAFHGLFLVASMLMPPSASGLSMDMTEDDRRYARYLLSPPESTVPDFLLAHEQGKAGSKPAKGDAGKAGTPDGPSEPQRRSTKGNRKVPGLPPPADARIAVNAGILGVLGSALPRELGGLFDPSELAGADPETYLGMLNSKDLGASAGFGGLHMHHVGRGGGGDVLGSVGLDRLGTVGDGPGGDGSYGVAIDGLRKRRARPVPTARHGVADVSGSLSKEVIRRTVARHLAEVRFCYEQGRMTRPELAGRISIGFIISPSGAVQSATVVQSDLASASTEACVRDAVRRWVFPQPEQGGLVSVTYPFMLQATE